MDLTLIEEAVRDSEGGIAEKKEVVIATLASTDVKNVRSSIDSGRALQLFLDHVSINSIPDFITDNSCPELEVKTTDKVGYAIKLLYDRDLYFAPVVDRLDSNFNKPKSAQEEFIGLISLGSMILWFLKEEEDHSSAYYYGDEDFFSMLEKEPPIAQTKVGELAKLFLWDPFFPIHMDDTLFHVLLLFSKHQLQVVPVTEKSNSLVSGFVSQCAVIRSLLESSGLEWFDSIADRALSEFRLFDNTNAIQIYGDQNMVEAIQLLWESKHGIIAVVERDTEKLIGSVRSSVLYLLLRHEDLYSDRKNLKVDQFIQLDAMRAESDTTTSKRSLKKKSVVDPAAMISPVTCRRTDSLKKVMKQLADTSSNFSFLIDECCNKLEGLIMSNEIMVQFAPPCMDSRIGGGGFFVSALNQTGCNINGETIVCNQGM